MKYFGCELYIQKDGAEVLRIPELLVRCSLESEPDAELDLAWIVWIVAGCGDTRETRRGRKVQ